MLRDSREPEVAHPSGSMNQTNMYEAAIMKTDTARANAIRSAGKQVGHACLMCVCRAYKFALPHCLKFSNSQSMRRAPW